MKFFNKLFPRAGKTCRQKKDYGILNKERTSRSPLISVVVTSYNYAAYIGQTLDSIPLLLCMQQCFCWYLLYLKENYSDCQDY